MLQAKYSFIFYNDDFQNKIKLKDYFYKVKNENDLKYHFEKQSL